MRVAIVAAVMAIAPSASAEDEHFSRRAPNVVALENVAGLAHVALSYPTTQQSAERLTQLGVIGNVPFGRLGVHRFVGHGLSLGASLQYLRARHAPLFGDDATIWSIAPKVGWATPVSTHGAIWARVGPTVLGGTIDRAAFGQIMASAELLAVTAPFPGFALSIGLFGDVGFAGRRALGDGSALPMRMAMVGLTLSVLADF